MIKEMLELEELHYLSGIMNSSKFGCEVHFNFILSNGQRSKQKEKDFVT